MSSLTVFRVVLINSGGVVDSSKRCSALTQYSVMVGLSAKLVEL